MPSHLPPLARNSVLSPLDTAGRAELVTRRLTDAIRLGVFADGHQLPSEAELAAQLNVATVTLREALAVLRQRGLVETRRGRGGGTFVCSPEAQAGARLAELPVDDLRDGGDHHAAISAAAAGLAAERASAPDLDRLREHVERLASVTADERAHADARFHVEIAATARSARLTRDEMLAQAELGRLTWHDGAAPGVDGHLAEHRSLLAAIAARDRDGAARLAAAHVTDEIARLLNLRLRGEPNRAPQAERRPRAMDVLAGVADTLDAVFASVGETRDALLDANTRARAEDRPLRRADLAPVRTRVHAHLAQHAGLAAGMGVVCSPGLLDDAPRWLEWWCVTPDAAPRRLIVSLDPADLDFYDYETADWFASPRETGRQNISGPFIDYSGTNQHILTLTVPVADDGRYLGVAGADVLVGRFAALIASSLATLGEDAALVNHRGRVIAANSSRYTSGALVSPRHLARLNTTAGPWEESDDGTAVARDPRIPWALLLNR